MLWVKYLTGAPAAESSAEASEPGGPGLEAQAARLEDLLMLSLQPKGAGRPSPGGQG